MPRICCSSCSYVVPDVAEVAGTVDMPQWVECPTEVGFSGKPILAIVGYPIQEPVGYFPSNDVILGHSSASSLVQYLFILGGLL